MPALLHALALAILLDADADKTSDEGSGHGAQSNYTHTNANEHDDARAKAAALSTTPRFTWDGCMCMQKWRLLGYELLQVTQYCGNPDHDINGEWCFVVNSTCKPLSHWGYCAPTPRCLIGDKVLAPALKGYLPAQLQAYRDQAVVLQWPDNSVNVIGMWDVTTLSGEACMHQRPTMSTESTLATTTTPIFLAPSQGNHYTSSVSSRVAFDPAKHGPALAVRFDLEFAEVMQRQATFRTNLMSAAKLILKEPHEALEVLNIMPGSVIVAIGVVPDACRFAEQSKTIACTRALINTRQRWEISIYDPNSILSRMIGSVDPMFPTILDAAECTRRDLACPWIIEAGHTQLACGGYHCDNQRAYPERDPWWFISLITFAGATPTCLCLGLISFKALVRGCNHYRHRRHVRAVRADAISLPRIEVHAEDLHLGEGWLCSICLGDVCPELDLLLLSCKHTLHFDCGMEWLERKLMCPMCRSPCRIKDCRIYTTPTLVVNFDSNEELVHEDLDELDNPCRATSADEDLSSHGSQPSLEAHVDTTESNIFLSTALPNVICDEEGNQQFS